MTRDADPTFFADRLAAPALRLPLEVAAGRDEAVRTGERRLDDALPLPLARLAPPALRFKLPAMRLAVAFRLGEVFDFAFPLPALPPLFFLAIGLAPVVRSPAGVEDYQKGPRRR